MTFDSSKWKNSEVYFPLENQIIWLFFVKLTLGKIKLINKFKSEIYLKINIKFNKFYKIIFINGIKDIWRSYKKWNF
jgi:hypothetical protein